MPPCGETSSVKVSTSSSFSWVCSSSELNFSDLNSLPTIHSTTTKTISMRLLKTIPQMPLLIKQCSSKLQKSVNFTQWYSRPSYLCNCSTRLTPVNLAIANSMYSKTSAITLGSSASQSSASLSSGPWSNMEVAL